MNGYLGIDVSKGYADFTLLDSNKKALEKVFQLDDTRKGHDDLKKQLQRMINDYGLEQVYCGLESTGGFENNWYNSIQQWSKTMSCYVVRLNPFVVKSNTAATLQRNVTDALSSQYIAEYLIAQHASVDYSEQQSKYSSYRSFNNHINLQKKQKAQLINELKAVLYSRFPELLRYCKESILDWVLEILIKYPSVSQLSKLKPEKLCKINYVDLEKATSIIKKATTTVASRNSNTDSFLIEHLATEIQQKQISIKKQKEFLAKQCNGDEVDLLTSITGIGKYSAAVFMIEIEDIRRFKTAKNLVSYFGMHPELKDSGDKKATYHLSKRGRASMRGALYMCAMTAVSYDAHLKSIYHRHRKKGFNHKQAIGVIMQKLLRVIWGVLTKKTCYDASIDKDNQERKVIKPDENKAEELKSKRRYQALDKEAPISSRQTKTRKAHSESQVSNAEQVRDHLNAPA
jgi:transposase